MADDLPFNKIVKNLRIKHRRRHREVAEAIGVAVSTYGNTESSQFRTLGRAKVEKLADFYSLPPAARERLLAAYDRHPETEFNTKRKERIDRDKQRRLGEVGKVKVALCDVLAVVIGSVDDLGQLCICREQDEFTNEVSSTNACELCAALRALGLPGWTSKSEVITRLAEVQQHLASLGATS